MQFNSSRFFIITYLFYFICNIDGMQNDIKFKLDTIQEITLFENPYCIHHVTDDIVALNSIHEFCMVNLKTKEKQYIPYENENIRTREIGAAIIQSDNKKVILANGRELMIYDRDVKNYQWFDCAKINSLKIDSHQDSFFCSTNGSITKYNYTTNQSSEISSSFFRILDIDSEKQMMYVQNYDGDVSLYSLHNLKEKYATIMVPRGGIREAMYQFSPDKSYLACGNRCFIYKVKQDEEGAEYFIQSLDNEWFKHMAFLPKGNILATISESSEGKSIIRYWDFFQELAKPIYMFDLDEKGSRDISVAPSGLEIMIAFRDKCIRSLVPFEIKKHYAYLFFVLNELKEQQKISQDILAYTMITLLKYLHF